MSQRRSQERRSERQQYILSSYQQQGLKTHSQQVQDKASRSAEQSEHQAIGRTQQLDQDAWREKAKLAEMAADATRVNSLLVKYKEESRKMDKESQDMDVAQRTLADIDAVDCVSPRRSGKRTLFADLNIRR